MKRRLDSKFLLDRIRGAFLGVLIGDSLGAPWEMMENSEMLRLTGGRGVRNYSDVPRGLFPNHPHKDFRTMQVGDYTDDFAFTSAVARGIISAGKIDPLAIAKEMIRVFPTVRGMGRATVEAIESFEEWFTTIGSSGRDPRIPASRVPRAGGGNGVAMRISGPAMFLALTNPSDTIGFRKALYEHGTLTHGDPRANHAGVAIGTVIQQIFFAEEPLEFPKQSLRANFLGKLLITLQDAERDNPPAFEDRVTMYSQLVKLLDERAFDSRESLEILTGTKCEAVYSVPFAIGLFLMYPKDIGRALYAAVNCGAFSEKPDRDTVAAMVGSMVGANIGYDRFCIEVPELASFRPEYILEVLNLADDFLEAVTKAVRD